MVDALSRREALVSTLNAKLLEFEYVKELYANDDDFASVYGACENVEREREREFMLDALLVGRPNLESYHMDYTLLYPYLVHLGSIFLWILF